MSKDNGRPTARARQRIPDFLRQFDRWLPWSLQKNPKTGKWTKVPHGSVLRPADYGAFEAVADRPVTSKQGVGFVFTGGVDKDGRRLIGLDVDACRDPATGALSPWSIELLNHYSRSQSEITPSGAGLRVFLWVENPPNALPTIKIPEDPPPGVDKTPEIQVFGCGSAQYVTVTGNQLPGTSDEPTTVADLSWLQGRYRVDELEDTEIELPVGDGPVPDAATIKARLEKIPHAAELLAGDWEAIGTDSASELWWRVLKHALKAADGHGRAAADFLLTSTAWGHGEIDSRDPDRYMRPDWVYRDVGRVAGKAKTKPAADVFDDVEGWEPPAAPGKPKKAPRLVPAAEFIENVDSQRFLVYGHLPARGLAQFFGDPGSGKTPFALSLALHVAAGAPTWFGHDIEAHGPVVYLVGEDAGGLRDRMDAQLEAMGKKVEDLEMHVSTIPGRLMEPADCLEWVHAIKAATGGKCALLVVDTQQANFGPGNENATDDMGAFIDNLKALTRRLGCLVLLVHHTGHAEKGRGRGSSALPGALDAQFVIERSGRGMVVSASPTKSKNWKDPEPLIGTLVPVEIGVDYKERPITAVTLCDEELDAADVFGDVPVPDELRTLTAYVEDLGGEPTTQEELRKLVGLTRAEIRTQLSEALELGLIEKTGGGKGRTKTVFRIGPAGRLLLAEETVGDEDDVGGLLS